MGILIKRQSMLDIDKGFENLAHILLAKSDKDSTKHIALLNDLQENLSNQDKLNDEEDGEKHSVFFDDCSKTDSDFSMGDSIYSQSPIQKTHSKA